MTEGSTNLEAVKQVVAGFIDPETGRDIAQMGQLGDLRLENGKLSLTLGLSTYLAPLWDDIRGQLVDLVKERFPDIGDVQIELRVHHRPPEKLGQIGLAAKSVIAVASGKGGVGKSTVAACLALGLKRAGCVVGLMDADVYGPSIPHLLGLSGRPAMYERPTGEVDPEGKPVVQRGIIPIDADGMKVMSMGFLVPPGEAVVWRGPMLHGAITQFLRDTDWGELDYLIIDMPPGTGDIALTLSQLLPLAGAVIVCTPQDVALLDAVKAIAMYGKVNIPILGMVENMSYFACPGCDRRYEIFGSGGAKRRAEEFSIPFLGEIPIRMEVRIRGDEGKTAVIFDNRETGRDFEQISYNLVKNLVAGRKEEPPLPSLSVLD